MMKLLWWEMKQIVDRYNTLAAVEYLEFTDTYHIWMHNKGVVLESVLQKGTEEAIDFENGYKPYVSSEQNWDGKQVVISSSRPKNTETCFTTCGDDVVTPLIGEGKRMAWDFSNTDDDISAPSGFKRKRLVVRFVDSIWIKQGTLYYFNTMKGSYGDMYIVCPAGQY